MKPSEILTAARELISAPERLARGQYARDINGEGCSSDDENAVCFCSIGAIHRVGGDWDEKRFLRAEMDGTIIDFHETHTHAEILSAFDRAIESAKEQGK